MTDDRKSGLALIAGMAGTIITMAFHPTFNDVAGTGGHAAFMSHLNVTVHSLALACLPMIFLGALGLTRRLDAPNRLAVAAVVLFGFAEVAVMIAATASGLLAPGIIHRMTSAAPGHDEIWRALLYLNGGLNQAFALLFAVASSAAIVLWSMAILKASPFPRWVGSYGCIFGPVAAIAVVSGHLRLNVHGFGAIMLGQAIWFIAVGVTLWRLQTGMARARGPS